MIDIKNLSKMSRTQLLSKIIFILSALFTVITLYKVNYTYAILPLIVIAVLALLDINLKNKKEILKDIYLFPLIYIEVIYFFQLITLIDAVEKFNLIYLAVLMHNNLLFQHIPMVLAIYLLVRAFGNHRAAAIITPIPFALLTITDFYVTRFRGHEIIFSDITSFGTAMNVANNYTFNPIIPIALIGVPYMLTVKCAFSLEVKKEKRSIPLRIVLAVCAAFSMCGTVMLTKNYFKDTKVEYWDYTGAYFNTFYMNFNGTILNSIVLKPDGYSIDNINAQTESITGEAPEDAPNIIVIMNESYMDIGVYNNVTGDITDPDPYWDSLTENTIHGYALSSVYGGNTANSEYEFLTGLTMYDLPEGSIVYNQFLKDDIISLPRFLNGLGYDSTAMHPFLADSWDRERVYPLMDFNNLIFLEDFTYTDDDAIRGYMSDECCYRNILMRCDENTDHPGFYYVITMQNHGSFGDEYNTGSFSPSVYIENPVDNDINNYLSLVHLSDIALEDFINELSQRDERYVVLIFGDHQPRLTFTDMNSDFEPGGRSWVIPYLIWTNYDLDPALIEELDHTTDYTSINYLSLDVMEVAGITPNPYYELLGRIREAIPCINAVGYRLEGESEFRSREDSDNPMLNLYSYLSYDVLFDDNDSSITTVY